jgi:hypothetical protein
VAQFLFVTDLDNTLVGDDAAMKLLNNRLEAHRQTYGTKIVYATGRSLTLYQELQQEKSLLHPDVLVTSVGTEIYQGEDQQLDPAWASILQEDWDRDRIWAIAGQFADLVPQPDTEQGLFKVSYYLSETVATDLLPELKTKLQAAGLSISLIYSGSKDLDILPQNANKGAAVAFLRQQFQVSPDRTVACGDSGNDLAFFEADEHLGIIVGNARTELLDWHHANPSNNRYLAQSAYAAGILEGLEYFDLLAVE